MASVFMCLNKHPILKNNIRDWDTFSRLTFRFDKDIVDQIDHIQQCMEFPILGPADALKKSWESIWCNGFMSANFMRQCTTCLQLVSPWADHGICLKPEDETDTPSSILSKKLYLGEYTTRVTHDPLRKYSTLSQLNMIEYYPVFWRMHDYLAVAYCVNHWMNKSDHGVPSRLKSLLEV
eukprot:843968_1